MTSEDLNDVLDKLIFSVSRSLQEIKEWDIDGEFHCHKCAREYLRDAQALHIDVDALLTFLHSRQGKQQIKQQE